jgi:hypothetical protein
LKRVYSSFVSQECHCQALRELVLGTGRSRQAGLRADFAHDDFRCRDLLLGGPFIPATICCWKISLFGNTLLR